MSLNAFCYTICFISPCLVQYQSTCSKVNCWPVFIFSNNIQCLVCFASVEFILIFKQVMSQSCCKDNWTIVHTKTKMTNRKYNLIIPLNHTLNSFFSTCTNTTFRWITLFYEIDQKFNVWDARNIILKFTFNVLNPCITNLYILRKRAMLSECDDFLLLFEAFSF